MPQVSVIVPVYRVEAYLAECLDSVLTQDFEDLEIVAVNDASPDRSLEILHRFEKRDPRLKVIDLPKNVGLAAARNAGLEQATGEFVQFLDSDDALNPRAISAAVERAADTGADVVLFDWTRDYDDGRVIPGTGGKILAQAPRTFTAAEYPQILQLLQIACNKLVRRELLERMKLRFQDGWYEDTSFTYPLLVGATSLTTLPLPLLRYRQRGGAITRSTGERHLEVLTQWDRAMKQALTLAPDNGDVRSILTAQMVKHSLLVLLQHRRIPAADHGAYVRELRRMHREYGPVSERHRGDRQQRMQLALLKQGSPALLRLHWALTRPAFLKGVRSGLLRKLKGAGAGPRRQEGRAKPDTRSQAGNTDG